MRRSIGAATLTLVCSALGPVPQAIAAPSNDAFADADEITLGEPVRGSTSGATSQSEEPWGCGASRIPSGPGSGPMPFTVQEMSVWYQLDATDGDRLEASVPWVSSTIDVRAFVLREGILVPVLCAGASPEHPLTEAWTLDGGGPIYLQVSTESSEPRASFEIALRTATGNPEMRPYANGEPENATSIPLPFATNVVTAFAQRSVPPYAPEGASYPPRVDVWYGIRPEADVLATVAGWMYNGPPLLEIYEAADRSTPLAVGHSSRDPLHGDIDGAHLAVELQAGADYLLRAGAGPQCQCDRLWLQIQAAPALDLAPTIVAAGDAQGGLDISGTIEGQPVAWDSIFETTPVWVQIEVDPLGDAPPFLTSEREVGHRFAYGTWLPGCTGTYDITVRLIARHHIERDVENDVASARVVVDSGPTVPGCLVGTHAQADLGWRS